MTTVAVCVPSIPPRAALLARALTSVAFQTRAADEISVAIDHDHSGAAVTRNRAWRSTSADYVAFVDDDDELNPEHLDVAEETSADLVRPWFEIVGGVDPFPDCFRTDPWNPADPRQTTVTVLWRRSALEAVDGFPEPRDGVDFLGNRAGEEFLAVCALNEMGGRIVCIPDRTWRWVHHGRNTSGIGANW
jgi:glycosyltransferase involved in cell wall biosynthesis